MKSFSTFAIAVTLFVLCIVEKESKRRDLEALRNQKQAIQNPALDNSGASSQVYADLKTATGELAREKFRLSEVSVSDSASKALEPTPFLGKLPLLNTLLSENNLN